MQTLKCLSTDSKCPNFESSLPSAETSWKYFPTKEEMNTSPIFSPILIQSPPLLLFFSPRIHKLGAKESLRVSDVGSGGKTEAANFETFHVLNFLMTKEPGTDQKIATKKLFLEIWRLKTNNNFFPIQIHNILEDEITRMHVWWLTSDTFDLKLDEKWGKLK